MSYSYNQRRKHIKQIKKATNPQKYFFIVEGQKKTFMDRKDSDGYMTVDYVETN